MFSSAQSFDDLGYSVAVGGDKLMVSVPGDDTRAENAGAVDSYTLLPPCIPAMSGRAVYATMILLLAAGVIVIRRRRSI